MSIDVLVAGAGPVGLAMAGELARYGLRVRIVDEAAARTDKSKALVVWSRTLELLDRAGAGAAMVAAGFKVKGGNVRAGNKEIVHFSLEGVASPHPYGLMLPQSETERLLEEHLRGLGVQVERNVVLTGFMEMEGGIRSTLKHLEGTSETVDSAWLVGCDGAHSAVRHGLGMQFEGDTQPSDWILADVHLDGVPALAEVSVMWHAEGALVVFPITATRFRVIADVGTTESGVAKADPTLVDVQALLDRRGPGGIRASEPIWLAGFHINERKVKDYRQGQGVSGRGCGPCSFAGGRAGDEYGDSGCVQPGVEAVAGSGRLRAGAAAEQL